MSFGRRRIALLLVALVATPAVAQGPPRTRLPAIGRVPDERQFVENLRRNLGGMRAEMVPEGRRHHAAAGAVIGGVVGLAVGLWLGDKARVSCEANCGALVPAAGAAGAALGAGTGALIGWAIPKR